MRGRIAYLVLVPMIVCGCSEPQQDPRPGKGTGAARTPDSKDKGKARSAKNSTVEPEQPVAEPMPAPSAVPTAGQDEAAAKIQGLGGEVMRNNTPGNPIYGVRVTGKKPDIAPLVDALEPLAQLEELSLDKAELTDSDLPPLAKLTQLKTLDLSGNQITDEGLAQLKPLAKLEVLRISQNQLTDAGLVHLAEFQQLKKLFLGRNEITDAGLVHLQSLTKLEELNLSGCSSVTDAALVHLENLSNLKEVWVPFTRVTDQGATAFQQKRSGVKVEK